MPLPATKVHHLDHLVLTVKSIPASIEWYVQNIGMRHEVFVSGEGVERHALVFGIAKINLHEAGKEFNPKAQTVQPGSADLCFITGDNVSQVRTRLIEADVKMEDLGSSVGSATDGDGTVIRTGARGKLRSIYCRDPDGNLIEISQYVETDI